IITRGDLDRGRKQLAETLRGQGVTANQLQEALDKRSADILREKIDDLLLVQKANQLSVNVDAEVSKYIGDLQLRVKIADPEKFHDWIREQSGQTFEDYRQDVKNGMLKQRVVQQEIGRTINISKADSQKYYNEHKSEFNRLPRTRTPPVWRPPRRRRKTWWPGRGAARSSPSWLAITPMLHRLNRAATCNRAGRREC
ncbi:MAG: SurA N-terminal domain-containing protein, partial [Acidobacteria bacterium]|nr:SurA N-terminal domain-containing protein [Acidobacteriota bacterium]